jgi:hypothetical protein
MNSVGSLRGSDHAVDSVARISVDAPDPQACARRDRAALVNRIAAKLLLHLDTVTSDEENGHVHRSGRNSAFLLLGS